MTYRDFKRWMDLVGATDDTVLEFQYPFAVGGPVTLIPEGRADLMQDFGTPRTVVFIMLVTKS